MTFGINTFLFTSPFTNDSFHLLEQIREWGFDSVELALEDASHVDAKAFKKALNDNNLVCGSVCVALGPDRDLRGPKEYQQNSLDYMNSVLDFMAEVGIPVIVGPLYSAVGRAELVTPDDYKQQWELAVNNLRTLAEYASQRKARLAIEPLNRYETDFINTCAQGLKLVNDINHAAAGLLLDSYHMNIEEKNSADAIRAAGNKLFHFHACGCDRGTPGNDHIDWNSIVAALKAINYDQSIVIESFVPDIKVIARAASIWRKFEPSPEDIGRKGLEFLRGKLNK